MERGVKGEAEGAGKEHVGTLGHTRCAWQCLVRSPLQSTRSERSVTLVPMGLPAAGVEKD